MFQQHQIVVSFENDKLYARLLNGPGNPTSNSYIHNFSSDPGLRDCLVRQHNGKRGLSEEGVQGVVRLQLGGHASTNHIDLLTNIEQDPTFNFGSTFYSRRTKAYCTMHSIWTGDFRIHGRQYSAHHVTSGVVTRRRPCLPLLPLRRIEAAGFPRPRISVCAGWSVSSLATRRDPGHRVPSCGPVSLAPLEGSCGHQRRVSASTPGKHLQWEFHAQYSNLDAVPATQ